MNMYMHMHMHMYMYMSRDARRWYTVPEPCDSCHPCS